MNGLQYIKNILKRFLPISIARYNQGTDALKSYIETENKKALSEYEKRLLALQHYLTETEKHLLENFEKFSEKANAALALDIQEQFTLTADIVNQTRSELHRLETELNKMLLSQKNDLLQAVDNAKATIPNKPIYWSNAFEKRVVKANWGDVSMLPDFEEKFLKLTRGMDPDSIQTIIRILIRQKNYLNSDQCQLDLFTRKEQEELRLLKENFNSEILQLSDHLFAYRQYLLPVNHFESSVFYYKHGIPDLNTASRVKGKSIIDVGGYIGDSVLVLSELEPDKIYTFEAMPDNFELLKKTLQINHIENAIAENMALGAKQGTCTMHVLGSCTTAMNREGIRFNGDIDVPVITLDDYVAQNNIHVGLIKVDIEGGEPDFLAGARRTICEQKPILLLSIYHNAHDFFELKPLLESWDIGYKFKIHKPTFENTSSETLLLAEITD